VFIPVDVFRLHLLPPPNQWISLAGAAAALAGCAFTPLAVWENRFAAPNVQQQAGQTIVKSGIYAVIRHPIYLGNLLLIGGACLWLGSYASLWCFAYLLVATVARIWVEERELRTRLPDYAAYAREVRARLVPFVF
jgi:protein-S-isoprenylcysteine O-methyltransferase Ste14